MRIPLCGLGQYRHSEGSERNIRETGTIYIHYGCAAEEFIMDRFQKIKNFPPFAKPMGGLWASPAQAPFGWADFCRREGYAPRSGLDKWFFFSVSTNTCVFRIASRKDFDLLPKCSAAKEFLDTKVPLIDFEMCRRRGIDAIEYRYSAVYREEALGDEMDRMLPGWDCDSILILNPQIIQPFFE